jgi:hypothetical protein
VTADSTVASGEGLANLTGTGDNGMDTKTFVNIKATARADQTAMAEESVAPVIRNGVDEADTTIFVPGVYSSGVSTRAKYRHWRLVALFLSASVVMI